MQFTQPCWNLVSQDAKDLINLMLTKEPTCRVTAEDVLKHKWFENYRKVLEQEKKNI